jgi:DUF438 domain-containing protein
MENQTYLDHLINDHSLIERALIMLEKQADKGEDIYIPLALTLIDFLEIYGDSCHNRKEEEVYFPYLLKKGFPPMGPIRIMLEEHEGERKYLTELKQMLIEKEQTGILNENFGSLVMEYVNLTKNHIWKENDILYPMGKKFLNQQDGEYLQTEFTKISFEIYKDNGYQRNLRLISTLEKQAGGRVNMLEVLPYEVIQNMLDALPIELSFVDENDIVRYYSKQDEKKIFTRSLSVIGRTVQQCHPQKSVHLVNQILSEMKDNQRDNAEFWINFGDKFIYISYFAVRDKLGKYQGCIEMVQDIKSYRELQGEKRLI